MEQAKVRIELFAEEDRDAAALEELKKDLAQLQANGLTNKDLALLLDEMEKVGDHFRIQRVKRIMQT